MGADAMGTAEGRMKKLYEHLDAKQRARLVVKAIGEGRAPDPALYQRMLPGQHEEYQGYATLIMATNSLGLLVQLLALKAENIAQALQSLVILRVYADTFDLLKGFVFRCAGEGQRVAERSGRRKLRFGPLDGSAPIGRDHLDRIEAEGSRVWMRVAGHLRQQVRSTLTGFWCELQSALTVVEQIAEEFEGDDPLCPEVRSSLDALMQKVQQLHLEAKGELGDFELPDPDDETISAVRQIVLMSARLYG